MHEGFIIYCMDFDPSQFCLPPTIRFTCSLCAACCHQWPVPLSHSDADRIAAHLGRSRSDLGFASLHYDQSARFSLTLPRDASGACRFLAPDKSCTLHDAYVDDLPVKPAMCAVFPYGFLPCPDGIFVSVSFASTAVIQNTGSLLSEAPVDKLEMIYRQYQALDTQAAKRSKQYFAAESMELVSGQALPFTEFRRLNNALLDDFVKNAAGSSKIDAVQLIAGFMQRLWRLDRLSNCRYGLAKWPGCSLEPQQLDNLLLSGLADRYMPKTGFAVDFDPHGHRLVRGVQDALTKNDYAGREYQSSGYPASDEAFRSLAQIDDLLLRYCLVKIYGRIYCGIGFGELSMMAGLGHLLCLVVLLKNSGLSYEGVAQSLRLVDAILTNTLYDRDCRSMLEIFFLDPDRPTRLKYSNAR